LHSLTATLLLLFLGSAFGVVRNASADQRVRNAAVPQASIDPRQIRLPIVDEADVRFARFYTIEGPSKSNAGPFVQDDQGFVWFGTPYGLNRFDGYNFKVFTHDPNNPHSISCSYINGLFKDRSGALWVGCNQFLDKFDSAVETFTRYPIPNVFHITQDARGTLWLSTRTGLYTLDTADGRIRRYAHDPGDPTSLESNDIKSSGEDRQGRFWVATGEGLDLFDRSAGKVGLHIPISEVSYPFSFYEDRFGVFWIYHVSGNPLAVFDRKTNTLTHFSFREESTHRLALTGVTGMLEDQNGVLWLSTNGAGLLKFDREHRRFLSYRHRLGDPESPAQDSVRGIFRDREGIIWASLGGFGLTRFTSRPLPFKRYRHDFGNPADRDEPFVGAIHEDRQGTLWIGTHEALHRIDRSTGRYRDFHLTGAGEGTDAITIGEDRLGYLWVGTYGHGLFRLDPRSVHAKRFHHNPADPHSLSNDIVPRVFVDHNGMVWAATHDGLDRFDSATGGFTTYRVDLQGVHPYYLDLAEDREGILWLGTESSGLLRFDPATAQFRIYQHEIDQPGSLSDNRVNSIHFDPSGVMWVGTQQGLARFDAVTGKFTNYSQREGLPGNDVSCVLEDRRGDLWMSTDNGVAQFNPQSRKVKSYSTADGLPGPDLTGWGTCFESTKGEMFFGGFSGATAFFPKDVIDSEYIPPVVLTDLRLFGTEVQPGGNSLLRMTINYTNNIVLPHTQNIFSIGFAALSYLNPRTNRYRYMLEGLDRNWTEVGSDRRFATYTTLPAAKYTLRVEGATNRGPWDEPGAVLRIEILPAWWNTWWFRVLSLAGSLALLWALHQLRVRQLERQLNVGLEARVSERTRIARELHDTLLQNLHGLMFQFQAARNMLPRRADEAAEVLDGAIGATEQTITESRSAIQHLRSEPLGEADLSEWLTATGQELARSQNANGDAPAFRLTVEGERKTLTALPQDEVCRITREILRNAFQHAQASRIEVDIRYDDRELRVRIRDDGKGIDPQVLKAGGSAGHWGLRGVRERAQQIGARLDFWSEARLGTEVELSVPGAIVYEKPKERRRFSLFRKV
jgi:signal transduction histidine kinase/ligand-binding sensor domain-containing protein